MKWRSNRMAFGLLIAAYAVATYVVFTRSAGARARRPITIRFAHWQLERGPPDGIAAVIKRYEELHPQVRVEPMQIPGLTIYGQWMRANLVGGTAPDLMEWGSWFDGTRDIPARYFAPLTSALARPNPYNRGTSQEKIAWVDTFHDKLLGPRRESPDPGQIYGVNITETSFRLFCNVALLRQITGAQAFPKTYDGMRRIFAQIRAYAKRTGRQISPLAGSRDNARTVAEVMFSAPLLGVNQSFDDGGNLYLYNPVVLAAYLQGRWRYSQPEVKAGLELVREVTQAMKPGFLQLRRDDAMVEFLQGQAVFLFFGTYDATTIRELAPFEVVPIRLPPVTPDDPIVGRYVIGLGGEGIGETSLCMFLNAASPHPQEALDFLQFLTSVPGNQLFTDHSLWLPAINDVKLPDPIKNFREYPQGYAFGQAPYDVIGTEVSLVWDRLFYKLCGDQGSVDAYAAALDEEMPRAIRRDLQSEMRNTLLLVKPKDAMIVAFAEMADDSAAGKTAAARQAEIESAQTMSEGLALQMKLTLDQTEETPATGSAPSL